MTYKQIGILGILTASMIAMYGVIPWMILGHNVQAQSAVTLQTSADITGDGSTHALGSGTGRWVQIIALSANGAAIRIGDSNASVSRGAAVAAGGGLLLPPSNNVNLWYSLSSIYYYAANGDKISVTWGN